MTKPMLLILGDTPTKETGFGRVVRNLLREWIAQDIFSEIHLWGIGYWGMPHNYPAHVKIYPAASPSRQRWEDIENLKRFANLLTSLPFTHVWMIQDVWGLAALSQLLRQIKQHRAIQSLLYFPVDAPLDRHWVEIVASVDTPVAYCEYGRDMVSTALRLPVGDRKLDRLRNAAVERIRVLPHGVDECFKPLVDQAENEEMRARLTDGHAKPDDLLLVSVATHQRRKGLAQTVHLWGALEDALLTNQERRVLLYMHCHETNGDEGSSLALVAEQLGLDDKIGKQLFFGHKSYFGTGKPPATDEEMNGIYNAADWLISTSLGEGWGLPLTEAMGARTPVAAPNHTSCVELLGMNERGWLLPLLSQPDMVIGDNSRLRRRVDVEKAAIELEDWMGELRDGEEVQARVRAAADWVAQPEMRWDYLARQWLIWMGVAP